MNCTARTKGGYGRQCRLLALEGMDKCSHHASLADASNDTQRTEIKRAMSGQVVHPLYIPTPLAYVVLKDADILARAYQLRKAGQTYKRIAEIINCEELPRFTVQGKVDWTDVRQAVEKAQHTVEAAARLASPRDS